MLRRIQPTKAITVLSVLVIALIPASVAATVQSQLAWYHGLGLFYGALGGAEISYLMFLLVLCRRPRFSSLRSPP